MKRLLSLLCTAVFLVSLSGCPESQPPVVRKTPQLKPAVKPAVPAESPKPDVKDDDAAPSAPETPAGATPGAATPGVAAFEPPTVTFKTPTGEPDEKAEIDAATNLIFENYYQKENQEKIKELLWSTNPDIRELAARRLKSDVDEATIQRLAALLVDPVAKVRQAAARRMQQNEHAAKHLDALIAASFDPDKEVATNAIQTIRYIEPAPVEAIPALLELLRHEEESRINAAASALGAMGPKAAVAVPRLQPLLDDYSTAYASAHALVAIGNYSAVVRKFKSSPSSTLMSALAEVDPTTPAITKLLGDFASDESKSDYERGNAYEALSEAHPVSEAGLKVLIDGTQSKKKDIRIYAYDALGDIEPKSEQAALVLLTAMSDPVEDVKKRAANSLGSYPLGDAKLIKGILNAAADKSFTAHDSLRSALGESAKPALPVLIEVLQDAEEDAKIRGTAVWMGGQFARYDDKFKEAITTLAEEENLPVVLDGYLAGVIEEDHPRCVPALVAGLKQQELPHLRYYLAEALGGYYPRIKLEDEADLQKVVPALIANVDDNSTLAATSAVRTLGVLKAEQAVPALIETLKKTPRDQEKRSEDPRHREALVSLGKIGPAAKDAIPLLMLFLKRDKESQDIGNSWPIAQTLAAITPAEDYDAKPVAAAVKAYIDRHKDEKYTSYRLSPVLVALSEFNVKHDTATIALYEKMLATEDTASIEGALNAIDNIGPDAASCLGGVLAVGEKKLKEGNFWSAGEIANALGAMGAQPDKSVPLLVKYLEAKPGPDGSTKRAIFAALAEFVTHAKAPVPGVLPALKSQLSAAESSIRDDAVDALATIVAFDPAAIDPLLEVASKDPSNNVRVEAYLAAYKAAPDNEKVRTEFIRSFAIDDYDLEEYYDELGDKVVPLVEAAIKHKEEAVRNGVIEYAEYHDNPKVVAAVNLALLDSDDPEKQWEAIQSLAEVKEYREKVLPYVVKSLSDEERRDEVSDLLEEIGLPAAKQVFAVALDEKAEMPVRIAAVKTILGSYTWNRHAGKLAPLRDHENQQLSTWAAIAMCEGVQAEPTPAMLDALTSEDEKMQEAALEAVYYDSDFSTELLTKLRTQLLKLLTSENEDVASSASYKLSDFELSGEELQTLAGLLEKPEHRQAAVQVLAYAENIPASAAPALAKIIREDEDNRSSARSALARIGEPALPALIEIAGDTELDDEIRIEASRGIAAMKKVPQENMRALAALVRGKLKPVSYHAAEALGKSGIGHPEVYKALANAAADEEFNSSTIYRVMQVLQEEEKLEPLVTALLEKLKTASDGRKPHIFGLATYADNDNADALKAGVEVMLSIKDDNARRNMIYSLSNYDTGELVTPLLDDKEATKVIAACNLFEELEATEAAIGKLKALTASKNAEIAFAAAAALARQDTEDRSAALPPLAAALKSEDEEKIEKALHSMAELEAAAKSQAPQILALLEEGEYDYSARNALAKVDPEAAAKYFIAKLDSEDEFRNAAYQLRNVGEAAAAAAPKLLAAMDDDQKLEPAAVALAAMGEAGTPAVAKLKAMLNDEFQARTAAELLGRFRDRAAPAAPELVKLLDSPDTQLVRSAMGSLRSIEKAEELSRPAIIKLLKHPERQIRNNAAYGLMNKEADEIGAAFAANVNDEKLRVRGAVYGVSKYEKQAAAVMPALVKLLEDKNLRQTALSTMGKFGAAAAPAVPEVQKLLEADPAKMPVQSAINVLGNIGPAAKPATAKIETFLDSKDEYMQRTAREALWKINPQRAEELKLEKPDEDE